MKKYVRNFERKEITLSVGPALSSNRSNHRDAS